MAPIEHVNTFFLLL